MVLVPSTSSMNEAFDTNTSTAMRLISHGARVWVAMQTEILCGLRVLCGEY